MIGKRLGALAAGVAGAHATSALKEVPMAAAVMARLPAMNLATWKADPFMLETHGRPLSKIWKASLRRSPQGP